MVSWAQAAGNGQYWSFETEGYPSEPLTGPQINTLASWHNFVNAPDTLANAPGQHGSGTHYMGGTAWGGHTCPDASAGLPGPRSKQRAAIIARAVTLRTPLEIDVPLTPAEITAITVGSAEQTWQRFTVNGQTLTQVLSTLLAASDPAAEAAAIAAAVVKALPASGTAVTAAQIAKAVADEQARRLVA